MPKPKSTLHPLEGQWVFLLSSAGIRIPCYIVSLVSFDPIDGLWMHIQSPHRNDTMFMRFEDVRHIMLTTEAEAVRAYKLAEEREGRVRDEFETQCAKLKVQAGDETIQ